VKLKKYYNNNNNKKKKKIRMDRLWRGHRTENQGQGQGQGHGAHDSRARAGDLIKD
jgi:hypothetical protein